MKFVLQLFLLINLCLAISRAELVTREWQGEYLLNPQHTDITANILFEAKLKSGYYYNNWSYLFDAKSKVNIRYCAINGTPVSYNFSENKLSLVYPKLFNQESILITIAYRLNQTSDNPYFFQQQITLPDWAAGATAKIKVTVPDDLIVCSQHYNWHKSGENTLVWSDPIPVDGYNELFFLTYRHYRWQVTRTTSFFGAKLFKGIDFYLPKIFTTGDGQIISRNISFSNQPLVSESTTDNINWHYRFANSNYLELKEHTWLNSGPEFCNYALEPEPRFTQINPEDKVLLRELTKEILSQENPQEKPVHVRLAEWVNQYLTYDYGYSGQQLSLKAILAKRRGVCEHYTQLYQSLCRYLGIPAITVAGYAYSNNQNLFPNGWDNHAWVLVWIDKKWQPIDPTWNLTRGVLPVSHLALFFSHQNQTSYRAENFQGQIKVNDPKLAVTPNKL